MRPYMGRMTGNCPLLTPEKTMTVIVKNPESGTIHTFGPFPADLAHKVARDACDMKFHVTMRSA